VVIGYAAAGFLRVQIPTTADHHIIIVVIETRIGGRGPAVHANGGGKDLLLSLVVVGL
jgi:hypothetical protein